MGEWLGMRWLRLHAMVAPFGVFAVTLLLLARSGQWGGWESLEPAASLVDLTAVVYGMIAVLVERGVRMVFWALDQRRQWREKRRNEAQADLITKMLDEGIPQTPEDMERFARDNGITIDRDRKPSR